MLKRTFGISTLQLAAAAVVLGLLTSMVLLVHKYIKDVDQKGYERGQKETLLKVAERDNKALVAAHTHIELLKNRVRAMEGEHATAIAKLDKQKTKEVADAEARKERFVDDVVSGRIRLFDPGNRAGRAADGGGGAAGEARASPGVGDGTAGSQLSDAASVFLSRLAGEADRVVLQLQTCQKILEEDRKVCR